MAAAALEAATRQAEWLRAYGPTSWDHYDVWANPLGRRAKEIYYTGSRLGLPCVAPFAAIDTFAPRLRTLLWHKSRFPIADAHWAMGFFNLARLEPDSRWVERGVEFLESLSRTRCPGFEHACWGYPFDWETCFGTFVAGTPLITTTPYAYEAFDSGYAATGDDRYLELMESAGRFAFHDLKDAEVAHGVFASSYTPSDSRRVVNASAYRAFLLAAAGSRFGHDDWLAAARGNIAFVLQSQLSDDSWYYAMDGKDQFIDNFHTCFVLKNLVKTERLLGDAEIGEAVARGYAFYKRRLLDGGRQPVPFARTQRPALHKRDLYDYAEGITLALLLADVDEDAPEIALSMVRAVLDEWSLEDGHFVTRRLLVGRNVVPYHRWPQSQMFRSLTEFALKARG